MADKIAHEEPLHDYEYHEHETDEPQGSTGYLMAVLLLVIAVVLIIVYGLPYIGASGNLGVNPPSGNVQNR